MQPLTCEGAPRDLGADQGRNLRAQLRSQHGGLLPWLPRLRRGARTRRVLRDLQRYYPHQYEQLTGMARGAGISLSKLAVASVEALLTPTQALGYRSDFGAHLAVATPGDALLRAAQPEGRFGSVELTRPVLSTALLAVNQAGLAVATEGRVNDASCQAPAALLARDCVERFDRVGAAVEWCLTRPCAPGTTLLLADARAELAAVEIGDTGRRVLAPLDGVLLPGVRQQRGADLAKTLFDSARLSQALWRELGRHATADPAACSLFVSQEDAKAATASAGSFATAK